MLALGPDRLARPGGGGTSPADRVRTVLAHLAEQAGAADGSARPPVPVLAERALGDQLVVLADDALDAGADPTEVAATLVELRRSL